MVSLVDGLGSPSYGLFAVRYQAGLLVFPGKGLGIKVKGALRGSGGGPLLRDPFHEFPLDRSVLRTVREIVPFVGIRLVIVQLFATVMISDIAVTFRPHSGVASLELDYSGALPLGLRVL